MLTPERLLQAWSREFEATVTAMTAATPAEHAGGEGAVPDLWWRTCFDAGGGVALCAGADERTWRTVAGAVLRSAGVLRPGVNELQATWFGMLGQVGTRVVAGLSEEPGVVTCEDGEPAAAPPPGARLHDLHMELEDVGLFVRVAAWPLASSTPGEEAESAWAMEALMDVSLPISICFGRTRMPLRETVKLTSGSVVVLDKSPADPVEVVVNDAVIATGEIVVVDGNYAVRLQTIAGRRQRLGLRPQNGRAVL